MKNIHKTLNDDTFKLLFSIASAIPSIVPVAIIGRAILGPKPLTEINFKNNSFSSLLLKPNKVFLFNGETEERL